MVHELPAEQHLQDILVDMGRQLGVNMLLSKVNAVVFAEPGPISLEEIAKRTGYSLASVSNAIKLLEQTHKISRVKLAGDKKVYVKFNNNLIEALQENFKRTSKHVIEPLQKELPHIIADLETELKKKNLSADKKKLIEEKIAWYTNYLKQNKLIQEMLEHINERFDELVRRK